MKPIFLIIFSLVVLNLLLCLFIFWPLSSDAVIYFLDVGQGDASLIVLPGPKPAYFLIDSGPASGGLVNLLRSVLPPLTSRLDLALLTHADSDHAGGLPALVSAFRLGAFSWNGLPAASSLWERLLAEFDSRQTPLIPLTSGDRLRYGPHAFSILHPPAGLGLNANTASLVILLESNGVRTLFTGDINAAIERRLLAANLLADVDILKVAHHGSDSSTAREFLNAISPEISIIQVGRDNSYGHPAPDVLNRLAAAGTLIFRNDQSGTIKVTINTASGRLRVSSIK